jgi:hypothetical protein
MLLSIFIVRMYVSASEKVRRFDMWTSISFFDTLDMASDTKNLLFEYAASLLELPHIYL